MRHVLIPYSPGFMEKLMLVRFLLLVVLTVGALSAQIPGAGVNCGDQLALAITNTMTLYKVPNAAVAVSYGGKLIATCSFGPSPSDPTKTLQPTNAFRIGGISGIITSAATLKLIEQKKLTLETKLFDLLPEIFPASGPPDARMRDIRVRDLLQQSAGWDSVVSKFDPYENWAAIATSLGIRGPARNRQIASYMLTRPLDYKPKNNYQESLFTTSLLGLVIEKASGLPYERYIQENILYPQGIYSMRLARSLAPGRTLNAAKAGFDEVTYASATTALSVFPFQRGVDAAYGGLYLEAMAPIEGWVGNVIDVVKFIDSFVGRRPGVLSSDSIQLALGRPDTAVQYNNGYFAMGLFVDPVYGPNLTWADQGSISGMDATPDGYTYAFLLNYTPVSPGKLRDDASYYISDALTRQPLNTSTPIDSLPAYAYPVPVNKPTTVAESGVVHGASFEAGIVPGNWVSIFGWNLSGTTRGWGDADFKNGNLPTDLDGVQVLFNGVPGYVAYISPTQINVQCPAIATTGAIRLQVSRNGVLSEPDAVEIRANAPEFFRYFAGGKAWVAALNTSSVTIGDPKILQGVLAAKAGDVISLYGSGFEASTAGKLITSAQTASGLAKVTIGGLPAEVSYTGLTGAGLFQVNVKVPGLGAGDHIVTLEFNNAKSLVTGLLAVR